MITHYLINLSCSLLYMLIINLQIMHCFLFHYKNHAYIIIIPLLSTTLYTKILTKLNINIFQINNYLSFQCFLHYDVKSFIVICCIFPVTVMCFEISLIFEFLGVFIAWFGVLTAEL